MPQTEATQIGLDWEFGLAFLKGYCVCSKSVVANLKDNFKRLYKFWKKKKLAKNQGHWHSPLGHVGLF